MTTEVLGTCHHDCPDSCGWVATVDGEGDQRVVVKLRGNKDHPFSVGELCPKVNRFLDRVYSPDRILTPLRRVGPKGSGEFEPVSWEDALSLTAENLHRVIDTHGAEAIVPWGSAGTQGLLQQSSLDQRLFARMGTSRQIGSLCGETAGWGMTATHGNAHGANPTDVEHAELVVLWGTNTRLTNRHLWPFVERARERGATIVVIDPMRTMTAESADRFIQPMPGTDVALMLAMMHVAIRDDHVDHDYVERYTEGFDELAAHVADWTPQRAADACGIDVETVEWLATTWAGTRRSFLRSLIGPEHHDDGAMFFRTLSCLPLLNGSWREVGGGFARSCGAWFDVAIDFGAFARPNLTNGAPRRGLNMNHLGATLTDPDIGAHALIVWNGNPLVTVPNAEAIRAGLLRDDLFTVVSEQFMTDTARYADVIFPACTELEQLDVMPAWGHLYLGWNNAAIDPLGESVPNTELWRRIAGAMGYTEPELFTSDLELIDEALRDTVDRETLERDGFIRLDLPDPLLPYAEGGFGFESGKAQFASPNLEAQGLPRLPTFTPPPPLDPRYPLALTTPKVHARFLNSSYSQLPKHGPAEGGPWVELHPDDAAARNIADGDEVTVHNEAGALVLTARIADRMRPGLAAVPFGWWSQHHDGEGTANSLTSAADTDWGGGVAYGDTRVEVSAGRR